MLELTRGLGHNHLIKAIAYYSIGQDHYLMFPWAGMGNLGDFWDKNGKLGPTAGKEEVVWMVNQIAGLADAVEKLHNSNCRPGDLKPSNILCFKTESDDLKPRLVITDVGAARVHNEDTRERDSINLPLQTYIKTIRYLVVGLYFLNLWTGSFTEPRSYCALESARKDSSRLKIRKSTSFSYRKLFHSNFASNGETTAHLSQEVDKVFAYINEDWRCAKGVAIQQLVDLIRHKLLVVELNGRISAEAMGKSLKDIVNGLTRDDEPINAIVSKAPDNAPTPPGPFSSTEMSGLVQNEEVPRAEGNLPGLVRRS